MILRPIGIVVSGRLEFGWEVVVDDSMARSPGSLVPVSEVRPHTGPPEPYVISPAFVNAHSHLEYRGMMGQVEAGDYWPWIREITKAKALQNSESVRMDCLLAARENRATGVAAVGEHSDRPFAGEALASEGLLGIIFQEIITLSGPRDARLDLVAASADTNRQAFGGPVALSPHAPHTVDHETLADVGASQGPFSIHVCETPDESEFTRSGSGIIQDLLARFGMPVEPTGKSVVESLSDLRLVRAGAQFVHCCDVGPADIEMMAAASVTVAHCPRSNRNLGCPTAPVREMLDAGIAVGLGLDSAASSGPIDMFAELRCALEVSKGRDNPLGAEEVWNMATTMGAASLPVGLPYWNLDRSGVEVPLIKIALADAASTEDLIMNSSPARIEWI